MDYKANKRYIDEIFKYSDMYSILVINPDGRLVRVHCPFSVQVIRDVAKLRKGQIKAVDMIKMSMELVEVYIIESKGYYWYNFIFHSKDSPGTVHESEASG